jgi:hypothetical protein
MTAETVITDATGRTLTVRRMPWQDRMALIRACGPAADIDRFMGLAMLAGTVRSIGDVPAMPMIRPEDVDHVIGKLGDEGIAAVSAWLRDNPTPPLDLAAAKN